MLFNRSATFKTQNKNLNLTVGRAAFRAMLEADGRCSNTLFLKGYG